MIKTVVLALAVTFDFSSPAYAYIDPSIASIVLQGLLAGLAGAAMFMRGVRERISRFLGLAPKNIDQNDPPTDNEKK